MISKAPHFLLFSAATDERSALSLEHRSTLNAAPSGGACKYWRFVLRTDDGDTKLDVADEEEGASPERLELLAVVRGLESLAQPSRVTLLTGSNSIRRGLRNGLDYWRENRWRWERFGRMAPIKNADLWRRIDRALDYHDVDCRAVRSNRSTDDLRSLGPSKRSSRPNSASPSPRRPAEAKSIPPAPRELGPIGQMRRFFSWCGLCRSTSSLVIAAH